MLQPRWYQSEAIQSIFDYFDNGNTGNPVVALPTGTGKGVVIGGFMYSVLSRWPRQRFVVATHVKELVEQNAKKLNEIWPHAPYGIYSAGLKSRDTMQPIIFGGIASMYECAEAFGHRDLLIVDECHLINPKGGKMYMSFIERLKERNPFLKVVGFTATKYRQGMGYITDDGLFTDVCYDMTDIKGFARLIAEGHLCPLVPRPLNTVLDTSGVGMSSSTGDFNLEALQAAVDKPDVTYAALQEALRHGYNCRSWLVFASGVEHSEHVALMLRQLGIPAQAVHSKLGKGVDPYTGQKRELRDIYIEQFKRGELRALVNNNVLTTGFDHPPIDLIVMLRPTMSTSLWVQMLGRGTRPYPGKHACLVLDFARNTARLGPINDPVIPKRKSGETGDAPVKICDQCGVYNHTSARFCVGCGAEFVFEEKIVKEASTQELIRSELPIIETYTVQRVYYYRHQGKNKPLPSLKCVYFLDGNIRQFVDFVNLEHEGFAGKRARDWWRQRTALEPPETIAEALNHVSTLRVPNRIRVWVNKVPYPEIVGYEYD